MAETKPLRKRDKTLTIKKICDAALEVFSTHSYETASTKKIAEKAGVNSALIFNYFDNKQGLFNYVFEKAATNSTFISVPIEYTGNLEKDLTNLTFTYLNHTLSSKNIVQNMLLLRNSTSNDNTLDDVFNERAIYVESLINHYKECGEIDRDYDSSRFSQNFIHMIDGMVLTLNIYSNETKEHTIERISPLVMLIASGLKCSSNPS